jgi:hypothetical protein
MSKPSPARYRKTTWPGYTTALRKRGSLLIGCPAPPACRRERVFAQEMTWLAPHERRSARPAGFSDAPIPLCQTIKLRFKPPLQRIEPWNRHGSE